jgi:hypothetical protein
MRMCVHMFHAPPIMCCILRYKRCKALQAEQCGAVVITGEVHAIHLDATSTMKL